MTPRDSRRRTLACTADTDRPASAASVASVARPSAARSRTSSRSVSSSRPGMPRRVAVGAAASRVRGGQTGDVPTGIEDAIDGLLTAVLLAAQDRPAVLVAGLVALVAVCWTVSWRLTRGVVTI